MFDGNQAVTDLARDLGGRLVFQKVSLITPQKAHKGVPLLQRCLRFIPTVTQRIGRTERNQFDVLFRSCDVLRRIDNDVAVLPTVLRVEDISAEGVDKVQPLVPKRQIPACRRYKFRRSARQGE